MQKRLTKKDYFFNNINLTADDDVYVGIDVHKIKCHIAIWLNDGIALTFVSPADNSAIARELDKLNPGLKQVVYEAGPTGFSLARTLAAASLPVAVIAPSKTLRPSAHESKSDIRMYKFVCCADNHISYSKVEAHLLFLCSQSVIGL